MVDRPTRDRLALLLRRLASGRLTTHDFEVAALERSPDPAVGAVRDWAVVFLCDLRGPRLVGRHALTAPERRAVARAVLFLRGALPYQWPPKPRWTILRSVAWLLTLGRVQSGAAAWAAWRRAGDIEVWPYTRATDVATAAAEWPIRQRPAA